MTVDHAQPCSALRLIAEEASMMYRHVRRFVGVHFPGHVERTTGKEQPRVIISRGQMAGFLKTGVAGFKGEFHFVGEYPAAIVGRYVDPDHWPTMDQADAIRDSNDAVCEAIRTGGGDPRLPDATPGPTLSYGGLVVVPGTEWPVYPHELGVRATAAQLRELALVREWPESMVCGAGEPEPCLRPANIPTPSTHPKMILPRRR